MLFSSKRIAGFFDCQNLWKECWVCPGIPSDTKTSLELPMICLGSLLGIARLKVIQNEYLSKVKYYSQQFNNLKLCRSSGLQMFFKIGVLKNFANYYQENICVGVSF